MLLQIIYYLRHGSVNEAYELVRELEPATPQESLIKGVVHATIGQSTSNREHLKMAQQCFQLVSPPSSLFPLRIALSVYSA